MLWWRLRGGGERVQQVSIEHPGAQTIPGKICSSNWSLISKVYPFDISLGGVLLQGSIDKERKGGGGQNISLREFTSAPFRFILISGL